MLTPISDSSKNSKKNSNNNKFNGYRASLGLEFGFGSICSSGSSNNSASYNNQHNIERPRRNTASQT